MKILLIAFMLCVATVSFSKPQPKAVSAKVTPEERRDATMAKAAATYAKATERIAAAQAKREASIKAKLAALNAKAAQLSSKETK